MTHRTTKNGRCYYCRWQQEKGHHHEACPTLNPSAMSEWEKGYDYGYNEYPVNCGLRRGKKTWELGFKMGSDDLEDSIAVASRAAMDCDY